MDLDKIKEIIDSNSLTKLQKRNYILQVISKDSNVVPAILFILSEQRHETLTKLKEQSEKINCLVAELESLKS